MELIKWKVKTPNKLSIKLIEEHKNQNVKLEDINRLHRLGNPKKSRHAKP